MGRFLYAFYALFVIMLSSSVGSCSSTGGSGSWGSSSSHSGWSSGGSHK
ncbi:hypothetical protein [Bordetella genomosp. 1]|nr:hypothetical protein [Bordetella genomosp. 1]